MGFAGVLWQWRRAEFNARAEAQQHQRAEANFQNARDAIDRMFIQVADELTGLPRTEQVRRKLLEDALQYYQGFLKEKGEDPSVKEGAAVAYVRVGTIYARFGRLDESLEPLGRGIALLEDLAARHPLTVRDRVELAQAHATIASAQSWFYVDNDQALAHTRKQLALWEELRREFPTVPNYLRMVARSETGLGNGLRDASRPEEAIEHFRRALQLCQDDHAQSSDAGEHQKLTAHVRHWWGAMLEQIGHRDEAEREYRAVNALREQLLAAHPNDAWLKSDLAHIKLYLAELLMKNGRLEEAEELLRAEVALHKQLVEDFPGTGDYRRHACWGLQALGRVLAAQGHWAEAEAAIQRSVEGEEKLVEDLPNVPEHRHGLAEYCYKLGLLLAASGRSDQANEAFRKSQGLWEQLVAPTPKTRTCERGFARMLATCPAAEFRNPQRAVILARQSMLHEGVKAEHWSLLGIAQYRAGDPAAAIESLHRSMELDNGGDAMQWLFLAMCRWKQDDRQKAREWYEKAMMWLEKVHPADEAYGRFRSEAAGLLGIKTADPVRDSSTPHKNSPP
jgi:tetratricopeptide (TPR) repeat protein